MQGGVNHVCSGSASEKCDAVDVPCVSKACPGGLKFATNSCGFGKSVVKDGGPAGYFHVFQLTAGNLQMSVVNSFGKREYCTNIISERTERTAATPTISATSAPAALPKPSASPSIRPTERPFFLTTRPWPSTDPTVWKNSASFTQNFSGIKFVAGATLADDRIWAADNDGVIWKLKWESTRWIADPGIRRDLYLEFFEF